MKPVEKCLSIEAVLQSAEANAVLRRINETSSDPRFQNISLTEALADTGIFDSVIAELRNLGLDREGTLNITPKILERRIKHIRELIEKEFRNKKIEKKRTIMELGDDDDLIIVLSSSSPRFREIIDMALAAAPFLGQTKSPQKSLSKPYPTTPAEVLRDLQIGSDAVSAETTIPFSSWSNKFLHGSDTLIPIGALVENLLFLGEITTSTGKKIYIHGIPIESLFIEETQRNPFASIMKGTSQELPKFNF